MLGRKKRKYTRRQPEMLASEINHWELTPDTKRAIFIVVLFTVAVLGIVSLFNGAGTLGVWLNQALSWLFGWGNWVALLMLLAWDFLLIFSGHFGLKKINYLGLCFLFISLIGLFDYFVLDQEASAITSTGSGGGYLGYLIGHNLSHLAGFWGGLIILLGLLLTGAIIGLNASFAQIGSRLSTLRWQREAAPSDELFDQPEETTEPEPLLEEGEAPVMETEEEIIDERRPSERPEKSSTFYRPIKKVDIPIDLLSSASSKPTSGDIKAISLKIQKALETFGIGVTMDDVNIGPTVTQYCMRPDDGVKLSQITTLQNDIALAVAAHPIRIEAPIPGKSLIGIEVPNQTASIVRLREIITSEAFHNRKSNLMLALGKDVSGKALMADLTKMPHLLIAGATGSGKSVAINSVIISLLWQNSPSDLKLILVDPKRVELSLYQDIPHLLTPIITDAKSTINALRWVVTEMDKRYEILAAGGKRNIESYNADNSVRMPYLVIIVDEFNTLMSVAPKEVESAVVRLAQMARAVGIHLILATQRPSVNVITGLIKANITSRMAFTVASQPDSRTILDMSGAEKLLGTGDMLFMSAELTKPRRIQGAYVSEKEVKGVADFLRQTGEPEYNAEITSGANGRTAGGSGNFDAADDEQEIREAAELVIRNNVGSATMLQSRMRVGYAKAARLLNTLEDLGIVGSSQGSKAREVLIEAEQLDYYLSGTARMSDLDNEDEDEENQNTNQPPEYFQ
ncbi:MAG: DNA translocase FtsK [Candidatus Komeilibacteria bacterium]